MYLRRSTRTLRGRTYVNYQLVESVRTPSGPRQNTICSLGDLGPGSREEWARRARKLEQAVAGQEDLFELSDAEAERVLEKVKTKRAANTQHAAQEPQLYGSERISVDPKLITTEHHREAANHHDSEDHEKAAHHAHIAHGHTLHATHHAEEAGKHHATEHA